MNIGPEGLMLSRGRVLTEFVTLSERWKLLGMCSQGPTTMTKKNQSLI